MAQIRGVEVGKILHTPSDVLEHCYPEMHRRMQKAAPESSAAAPVLHEDPPSPPPPVASSKSKSKKAKAEVKAVEEPAAERITEPGPEPTSEPITGYEPFKDV